MKEDKNPEAKNDEKNRNEKIEIDRELKSELIRSNRIVENQIFENRIDREWLTTIEAAYWLAITPNALRILVHRNQVRVYKFGRRLRFRMTDLQALFLRKGA
jgi:excisionase family DNA binding protein